jgi:ketosteroid isomerase-like protein
MRWDRAVRALDLMRRYIELARAGDWDRALGFFADDLVFHIPGRSAHAGELRGRDAAARYIEAARALSHGNHVEVELIDMLASEERVALIVRERFDRPEGPVEIRRANVYRIEDDHIAEVWIFEHNQYEVDALMGELRL